MWVIVIYVVDSFSDSSLSSAAIALLNNHKAEFDTAKVRQSTIWNTCLCVPLTKLPLWTVDRMTLAKPLRSLSTWPVQLVVAVCVNISKFSFKNVLFEQYFFSVCYSCIMELFVYTVEPIFYDHTQNNIGVIVKDGWSLMRVDSQCVYHPLLEMWSLMRDHKFGILL